MGRISCIEVENFKSYAGQQVIPFHDRFNAVIGPNGAGKSNLMEAICFVLGIQAKSIRSGALKDLIFKAERVGGKGGGAAAQRLSARVTLVYTVDEHDVTEFESLDEGGVDGTAELDLSALQEGDDIHFTRTVSPAGVGSYRISATRSDERDVTHEAYNKALESIKVLVSARTFLVFQGDVERIASQSLNALFDKISGSHDISEKYEMQKEAYKTAEQDMLFARNKMMSAKKLSKHAREQKEEADRYQAKLSERAKKRTEYALWRLFEIEQQMEAHEEERDAAAEQLGELVEKQALKDEAYKQAKQEHAKLSRAAAKGHKRLLELKQEQQSQQSTVIKRTEQVRVCSHRLNVDKQKVVDAQRDVAEQKEQCDALEADIAALQADVDKLNAADADGGSTALNAQQKAEYEQLKEQAREKTVRQRAEHTALSRELQSNTDSLEKLQAETDERVALRRRLEADAEEQRGREHELAEHIAKTKREIVEKQKLVDDGATQRATAEKELGKVSKELDEVSLVLHAAKDDRRQNDKEAKKLECLAALKRNFAGVKGRLGDLMKPKQRKYDMAATVAVGRHMDSIVITTEAVGFDCIKYMRDQQIGVGNFIPLDTIRPKPVNERLRNLGPKFKLVQDVIDVDADVKPALQFAVGNTVLCNTLDDAQALCFERDVRVKAVTLKGHVISKSGAMTGGSTANDKDRARRWDDANNERSVAGLKQRKSELQERERALTRSLESSATRRRLQELQADLDQKKNKLKWLDADFKTAHKKVAEAAGQVKTLDGQLKKQKPALQKLTAEKASKEKALAKLGSIITKEENKIFAKFSGAAAMGADNVRDYEEKEEARQAALEMERVAKEAQLEQLRNHLEFKQRRDLQGAVVTLRAKIKADERKLSKLQAADSKDKSAREKTKAQLEELQTDEDATAASMAECAERMKSIKRGKDLLRQEHDKCRAIVNEKEMKLERLRTRRHDQLRDAAREQIELPHIKAKGRGRGGRKGSRHVDASSSDDEDEDESGSEAQSRHGSSGSSTTTGFSQASSRAVLRDDKQTARIDYSSVRRRAARNAAEFDDMDRKFVDAIQVLDKEIEAMKPNLKASEMYSKTEKEFKDLEAQVNELRRQHRSRMTEFHLTQKQRKRLFKTAVEHVRDKLKGIYIKLTQSKTHKMGGDARLEWDEDADEPWIPENENEIKLNCMPPGKRFRAMDQLSGGEQTVAALSLLFACHSFYKTPFFVLDEIDAALDNANVNRVAKYIREWSEVDDESEDAAGRKQVQFVVISLKDDFYTKAHSLVGVYKDQKTQSSGSLTLPLEQLAH